LGFEAAEFWSLLEALGGYGEEEGEKRRRTPARPRRAHVWMATTREWTGRHTQTCLTLTCLKLSGTARRALRVVGDGFQMVVEPALRK